MWQVNFRTAMKAHRRPITGSVVAGLLAGALLLAGYAASTSSVGLPRLTWPEIISLALLIALVVALIFGWWTMRSIPRYPQNPLEYHQLEVEQDVEREWGKALGFLRGLIAQAENCSASVIEVHMKRVDSHSDASATMYAVLIAMHAKICDLARAIADLSQRGHAESALALWRSAFELEVNIAYISDKSQADPEIGERFWDWGTITRLKFSNPNSQELAQLKSKYPGWQTDSDIGWTGAKNVMGFNRRAQAAGYQKGNRPNQYNPLDIYELANAYVHNDATAIFNDLGQNPTWSKGPSAKGLDLPIPLIASTVERATQMLIDCQDERVTEYLKTFDIFVKLCKSQVYLEASMVPERLTTQFLTLNNSITVEVEGGGERVITPMRRESDPEEVVRQITERRRRQAEQQDNEKT